MKLWQNDRLTDLPGVSFFIHFQRLAGNPWFGKQSKGQFWLLTVFNPINPGAWMDRKRRELSFCRIFTGDRILLVVFNPINPGAWIDRKRREFSFCRIFTGDRILLPIFNPINPGAWMTQIVRDYHLVRIPIAVNPGVQLGQKLRTFSFCRIFTGDPRSIGSINLWQKRWLIYKKMAEKKRRTREN